MRIGIDLRALQCPSRFMGIGTYTRHLLGSLHQAKGSHSLIPFAQIDPIHSNGKNPFLQQELSQGGFWIDGLGSFQRQWARHRLDLCHILEILPTIAVTDRTVVTAYDLIPLIFPKVYLAWHRIHNWNLRSYFRSLKKAGKIIAISQQTRQDLIRLLRIPEDRIAVIYPGIAPTFRPLSDPALLQSVRARYRLEDRYILYVGSCDWRKNLPGLLKSFSRFCRQGGPKDVQLVLAGRVSESRGKRLRRQAAALGIAHRLRLLGYVPEKDLVTLYSAASMLVYPSLYEGFGFPPLEAMACGTPVICSRNSSLKEVADGSALSVNPLDIEALTEGMRRLTLDQDLRRTLIEKGLAQARRFSWEETARQTIALYERIGAR